MAPTMSRKYSATSSSGTSNTPLPPPRPPPFLLKPSFWRLKTHHHNPSDTPTRTTPGASGSGTSSAAVLSRSRRSCSKTFCKETRECGCCCFSANTIASRSVCAVQVLQKLCVTLHTVCRHCPHLGQSQQAVPWHPAHRCFLDLFNVLRVYQPTRHRSRDHRQPQHALAGDFACIQACKPHAALTRTSDASHQLANYIGARDMFITPPCLSRSKPTLQARSPRLFS